MSKITELLDVAYRIRYSYSSNFDDDVVYGSTRVLLTEGYTTRDDIPQIIAARRAVPLHAVTVLAVTPS